METKLLTADAYRHALALRDLTDPVYGPHAMQLLAAEIVRSLREAWNCDVVVHRASPVVSLEDNYGRLGYPADAAARDARYTRYVSATSVLRTHASAMIPGLLRLIANAVYPDVLLVCPGLVYRRDRIERLSVGEPHQLDLWRISKTPLDARDLRQMIDVVIAAALPEHECRALPTTHPYTLNGLEVEVREGDRWVEVAECGLASPSVLGGSGLPPDYSGLAMGLGLDRLLMLRKGIDDIRLLRSDDERVASQMLGLAGYRPVSSQPAAIRDLSIAVRNDADAEELGDRIRDALGDDAESIEAVTVISETSGDDLPRQAVERLGLRPGQQNLLVRLVLRHATRTLTDAEANTLRDRVYAVIHEGSVYQWASSGPPTGPRTPRTSSSHDATATVPCHSSRISRSARPSR
jgi:phenylalanyl-tRNA synthetase alpha chain